MAIVIIIIIIIITIITSSSSSSNFRCSMVLLDLTTSNRQTWLFSSTSTYHSTDLLTARGVAHLVVHGTTGTTSYETIPHVQLESSGGVLSTVDMVVQRRDGPRRLRDHDDQGCSGAGTRGDGIPHFFDMGDAFPTPPFFGLKFVQTLLHCCNWLLTET